MPLLTYFSWVGLALGWGVRRFHDNIYMFSNPTEFGTSEYIVNTLMIDAMADATVQECPVRPKYLGEKVLVPLSRSTCRNYCTATGTSALLLFLFCFNHHFHFPAQLVGGFTLSDLLDKPWSQVSSLLPPGTCLQFLSRIGFSIPTARRFHRMLLARALALSANQFLCKKKSLRVCALGDN